MCPVFLDGGKYLVSTVRVWHFAWKRLGFASSGLFLTNHTSSFSIFWLVIGETLLTPTKYFHTATSALNWGRSKRGPRKEDPPARRCTQASLFQKTPSSGSTHINIPRATSQCPLWVGDVETRWISGRAPSNYRPSYQKRRRYQQEQEQQPW